MTLYAIREQDGDRPIAYVEHDGPPAATIEAWEVGEWHEGWQHPDELVAEPVPVLGRRIRELREQRRLTQTAAAHLAGMAQPAWARLEAGRVVPTWPTVLRVAAALDVGLDELAGWE